MVTAGEIAQEGVKSAYGKPAKYTYAVGTSNGGYQVRRALETAPKVFDGGVDWEGTFVDEEAPNILTDLPPAILNWPDYVASTFNPASTAAKNIVAAGYPPDIVAPSIPVGAYIAIHVGKLFELVLGSDAMPVAEAARPGVQHLRERHRDLQLHATALVLRRRREHGRLRHDRRHPEAADHGCGHDGRAAADRPPCARLCAQGGGGAR